MDNTAEPQPLPYWMQRILAELEDDDQFLPSYERYPLTPEQELPF